MSMTLNGHDLYSFIISGAQKLIIHEKHLNQINVFPVADGDTGSNLAFTMKGVIRSAKKSSSVKDTIQSITNSAMTSSYGNSGTIVAGYFNGLSKSFSQKDSITTRELVDGLSSSVDDAYRSITSPQEGTILTVMRAFGSYVKEHYSDQIDLATLLKDAIKYTKEVLEETKNQLEVLKSADVVDAGAKGFVYFLEGIFEYLTKGKVSDTISEPIPQMVLEHDYDIRYRYCTEFILEPKETYERKSVEDYLMGQGDSVIVTELPDYTKIHLHTDQPELSALFLQNHGKIVESKVDDMVIQYEIANHRQHDIGILTDSIADIPEQLIKDKQITVIPIQMIIDDAIYMDRVTLRSDNTYRLIEQAKVYPKSSQPSEKYIEKTIEYLLNHYDHLIGIFVSGKMSGTVDKVRKVVEKGGYDKVHIIDSKLNSGGEGLVLKSAYEAIERGLDVDEIKRTVEATIDHTKIFVKIPDLSYAARSGRVPKVVGKIAGLLNMKVIISIDEDGEGIVTKERSLIKRIKRQMKKGGILEYAVVHSSNEEKAKQFALKVTEIIGKEPVMIENVSAVVAAFIGKGAIGIAYTERT